MEEIRRYILSVCIAAMICGILKSLSEKSGASFHIIQVVCGVFLTVTAIRPLIGFQINDISQIVLPHSLDAEMIIDLAQQETDEAIGEIIIQKSEAYILDKAASMDVQIELQIQLSNGTTGVPCAAVITGNVSPYTKLRLMEIMEADLGISREAQIWKT